MGTRPLFSAMHHQFCDIFGYGDNAGVGQKIGGKVQQNFAANFFTNPCAIRMSYSLNYSGTPVMPGRWQTVSGADNKLYIYRINDLMLYLRQAFGDADKTARNPKASDFAGMKGILVFNAHFHDCTGHVTLWNGNICTDQCFFSRAYEASLWQLG